MSGQAVPLAQALGLGAVLALAFFALGFTLGQEAWRAGFARGLAAGLDRMTTVLGQEDPANFAHRVRQRDRIEAAVLEDPRLRVSRSQRLALDTDPALGRLYRLRARLAARMRRPDQAARGPLETGGAA